MLFLIDQPNGTQNLADLPNANHIQGKILWNESLHGPMPSNVVAGAMTLVVDTDELGNEVSRHIEVDAAKLTKLNKDKADAVAAKQTKDKKEADTSVLKEKLKSGVDLNPKEINDLLRGTL